MQWRYRKGRKVSGGKYRKMSKKKRRMRGRDFVPTMIGTKKILVLRKRGGNLKSLAIKVETANVVVGKEIKKAKILSVKENNANPQFIRSNVITKGAVIETDIGRAKITSRPGQHGSVDAVLIEQKK